LVDWRKAEDKHAREKATQDDAPRKGRGRPRKNVAGGAGQAVVKESAASRKRKAAELSKTRVGDSDGEEEDENDDEEEDEDEENEEEDDEEDEMSEIGEGTKAGAFGAPIQGRQDDPMDFEMSHLHLRKPQWDGAARLRTPSLVVRGRLQRLRQLCDSLCARSD
jgi:hypothetical protein